MRLYVSVVDRLSANAQETGFVYLIDWEQQKIIKKIPTQDASLTKFWNPRGGNRGSRGIMIYDDKVFVATATSIKVFNKELNLLDNITNEYFAGLHDIFVGNQGILALSTVHDAVIKVDFSGKTLFIWRGSESAYLQRILKFSGRPGLILDHNKIDEAYMSTNRLHFSGLTVHDKYAYLLSGKHGALVRLDPKIPNSEKILISRAHLESPHNICIKDGKFFINNTRKQELCVYSPRGAILKRIDTSIYPVKKVSMFATPGWQRGLAHLFGSVFVVGTSPLTIFSVDVDQKKILDVYKISERTTLSSYSICVDR